MLAHIIIAFFVLLFLVAGLLRLGIPLLFALIVPTIFHEWYYANYVLTNGIWYAMLTMVAMSWVVSFVRKVREWFC